jgi:hypothetical protein
MGADVTGLHDLATAFHASAAAVGPELAAVVRKGALNVKNDWRANATSSAGRHARLYPASIGYDMTQEPDGASAEIGPDKGRPQGALGNLLEFGSANNPPHNDGGRALDAEEPRMVAAVEAVATRLVADL